MDDRPAPERLAVRFEYRFDRLFAAKLEHAYALLIPDQRWPVGRPVAPPQETVNEPPRRYLRPRVVGSAARE